MKTSKFLSFIMSSLVAMACTSCSSSDDEILTPDPSVKTYTMTVAAQKGSNGTRALSLDGTTLKSTWTAGDKVKVYKVDTELGELTAQSTGATSMLIGNLSGDLNVNDNLTLKYLSADYNSQDGTLTGTAKSIDKVCDYSTAMVTVESISGSDISTTDADFANQQAVVKFTLKNADGSALPSNPTAFTMSDGTSTVTLTSIPAATYTANGGDGVLYVAFPGLNSSATISLEATVGSDTYAFEKTGITFTNSKYYGVTVKMKRQASGDVISGKFTVNAGGDQVQFAKGNLQATTEDLGAHWTWAFAAHQWNYIGDAAANNSMNTNGTGTVTANGTVDLFGWVGASTPWTNDAAIHGISASEDFNDYGTSATEAMKSNWGNTMGSGWRTLTGGPGGEWDYVFNTRISGATVNSTANARYTYATINTDGTSVNGVILFPDGATIAAGEATTWGNINSESSWGTKCTTAQWMALEAKGCVFLPAAGRRGNDGNKIKYVGADGYYWTSSSYSADFQAAYAVHITTSELKTLSHNDRIRGYAVRLVRDAE